MCAPCFQVIGKNYRCLLDKLQLFEGREQFFRQKKSLRIFFMQTIFIYLVSFGCTGSSGELREQFFCQKKSLRIFFMQTIFIYLVSFGCTGSSGELSPAVAGGGDSLAAQHGL